MRRPRPSSPSQLWLGVVLVGSAASSGCGAAAKAVAESPAVASAGKQVVKEALPTGIAETLRALNDPETRRQFGMLAASPEMQIFTTALGAGMARGMAQSALSPLPRAAWTDGEGAVSTSTVAIGTASPYGSSAVVERLGAADLPIGPLSFGTLSPGMLLPGTVPDARTRETLLEQVGAAALGHMGASLAPTIERTADRAVRTSIAAAADAFAEPETREAFGRALAETMVRDLGPALATTLRQELAPAIELASERAGRSAMLGATEALFGDQTTGSSGAIPTGRLQQMLEETIAMAKVAAVALGLLILVLIALVAKLAIDGRRDARRAAKLEATLMMLSRGEAGAASLERPST